MLMTEPEPVCFSILPLRLSVTNPVLNVSVDVRSILSSNIILARFSSVVSKPLIAATALSTSLYKVVESRNKIATFGSTYTIETVTDDIFELSCTDIAVTVIVGDVSSIPTVSNPVSEI